MTTSDQRRAFSAAEIGTLYRDDNRSIVEKYGKFLTPYLKIEISDKQDETLFSSETAVTEGIYDLDGLLLETLEFEESIEECSSINITFLNPDLSLEDSEYFLHGNNIDIFMGYDGRPPYFMARGIIVEVKPNYPSDTTPTIQITCYDKSYFMMEEGRAEINPEGSTWWERTSRTVSQRPRVEQRIINDSYGDSDPDEETLSEIARDNYLADAQGVDVNRRTEGIETFLDEGGQPSLEEIHGGTIEVPVGEDNTDGIFNAGIPDYLRQNQPNNIPQQRQSSWERTRFPRQRRNAGQVWRNKTDSEIVIEILLSYGIVPYVQATNERVRRPVNRNRRRELTEEEVFASDPGLGLTEEELTQAAEDDRQEGESLAESRERLREELEDPADFDSFRLEEHYVYEASQTQDLQQAREVENITDGLITTGQSFAAGLGDYQWQDDFRFRNVSADTWIDDTPPETESSRRENPDRVVTQRSGVSDWDFIQNLSEDHGFIFFVFFHIDSRRWIGYWGPPSNIPQYREFIFRYNSGDDSTVGTININTSVKNQSTEMDLIYVDPLSNRENRLRVNLENISNESQEVRNGIDANRLREPIGDGPEVVLLVHGQRSLVHADRRFTSAEDARNWLVAFWLRYAEEFFFIEGNTIVGIMEMRAREHHSFEGINRYSGRFFVTQARHSLGPSRGYQTSFTARKVTSIGDGENAADHLLNVEQNELGTLTANTESLVEEGI